MITESVDYGLGELLDIYRPTTLPPGGRSPETYPVVLLWHGVGVAERRVLSRLALATAASGAVVVVPDWRSNAADRGRGHLLESLAFTRARISEYGGDATRFVLAGWSRGARAGMGLLLRPQVVDGWRPGAFVGIAGGYGERPDGRNAAAPTTGTIPLDDARTSSAAPLPVWLVHGTADEAVDIANSRDVARVLRARGWTVCLDEVADADHTSIVGDEREGNVADASARHAALTANALAAAVATARGR